MDANAVGNGDSSLAIVATATGTRNLVITNDQICDTQTEIIPGTDLQPPRPRIQYSTDLRKELSLDVLASLGGSSADDPKSVEVSITDLASVRVDMEFISELSSLSRHLDQEDSSAPETVLPTTAVPLVDPNQRPDRSEAILTSEVSLPQCTSSRSPKCLSVVPLDDSAGIDSSPSGLCPATGKLPAFPVAEFLSPSFDSLIPVSSAYALGSSGHNSFLIADATPELLSSHARQEFPESVSDAVLTAADRSCVPAEPLSSSATCSTITEGAPVKFEASHESLHPLSPSPLHSYASEVAAVAVITSSLPLESWTDRLIPAPLNAAAAACEALPTTLEPFSYPSGDALVGGSPGCAEHTLVGVKLSCPREKFYSDAPASPESYPLQVDPVLFAPADLLTSDSSLGTAVKGSALASHSLPLSVFHADVPSAGRPASSTSLLSPDIVLSPASVSALISGGSSALKSPPVSVDLSSPASNTIVLDCSRPAANPSKSPGCRCAAVNLPVSDLTPASFVASAVLRRVLPGDPVSTPCLTGRYWDVSTSISLGISLSAYFDGARPRFWGRKTAREKRLAEAGDDFNNTKGNGLSDLENFEEVAELESMLEAQKKLVQWQIDEIQRIATLQFEMTGSNPLSEEAMWEVLGVKEGGKKSGESLRAETFTCLQEIFALKDTLTKKEARDISFTSGASLTQIRDFFAAQRSLVRRYVQQAHDEAGRLGVKDASGQTEHIAVLNTIADVEKDLGFDKLIGAESIEKIIEVMRAEKGFAGQVQLLQVILHTDSAALILRRFLERGGLKLLGGWLVEAVTEQQTSLICHLLKVLDHLPMSNAVSQQMPPLVQNVKNLRFDHVSSITGQARSLFAKWCKLFSPKTEGVKSTGSPGKTIIRGFTMPSGGPKRNRDPPAGPLASGSIKKKVRAEVLQREIKSSQIAGPGSPSSNGMIQGVPVYPSSGHLSALVPPLAKPRWSSTLQPSESAVAAVSVSRKRLASKALGDYPINRRKVLCVEDSHLGKSVVSKPAQISKTSRPLSTDDIYKAKKLERLMQEPTGKSRKKLVAVQDESQAQNVLLQTGAPKKGVSSLVPERPSSAKRVSGITLSLGQRRWRGEALAGLSSQDELETVTRMNFPSISPEYSDSKLASTPMSSQEVFRMTHTPAHAGTVTGDAFEDTVYKKNSNSETRMDKDAFPSSLLRSSSQGLPLTMHNSGSAPRSPTVVPVSVVANSMVSDAILSVEVGHPIHFLQGSSSLVLEHIDSTLMEEMAASNIKSKPGAVESVCSSPASSKPPEGRPEELSGCSELGGIMKFVDNSTLDDTEGKYELSFGPEVEVENNLSPHEMTLSDFYATLRASMVRWRIPPEYQPDSQWNVSAGEDSKEKEIQSGRVRREEEAFYPELSAVPDDPKDPWEEEPCYDDSLTLEIFVECGQRKAFGKVNNQSDISKSAIVNSTQDGSQALLVESEVASNSKQNATINHGQRFTVDLLSKVAPVNRLDLVLQQLSTGGGGGTHDPDLLALLLRNPELVSQLTSGRACSPSGISNSGVFLQPVDPVKQVNSGGNNGAGLSMPAGDLGQERLIPQNNSKALGIPLQPGRPVPSVDQTPPEIMRVQDTISMMPHPGMGRQQTVVGFGPQGGVDSRFLSPQMLSVGARNTRDISGWEHLRVPPPPPLVSPMQTVINQALQPPLPNHQPNKQSNWPEINGWAGAGRPLNSLTRPTQEQFHTRQTITTHNVRLPNFGVVVRVPEGEGGPDTSVVSQPDGHSRNWSNGCDGTPPAHENTVMHAGQETSAGRNTRWPRTVVRPHDQLIGPGSRDFPNFNNGRQSNVVENRTLWTANEGTRSVLPPFQGAYVLPAPPPYLPLWQGQEGSIRHLQGSALASFSNTRNLRLPQQHLWQNNMGPASREMWRGPS